MPYVQKNHPYPKTSCGRRRTFMTASTPKFLTEDESPMQKRKSKRKRKPDVRRTIGPGKNFNKARSTGTGAAAGGGMTKKGVAEYRRKNPGSKLRTAVTTPPSRLKKGSKAAKRRKSFCARSRNWKSKRGLAARRRWNC
tara:strand:+ start:195 stop:611 length:417 start_codon:yes stop_codon:yes gene_type:complete